MNYSPSNKNYCRSSVRVIFITVGRSRVRRQGPDRDTRHWVLSLILTSLNKRSWIVLNVEMILIIALGWTDEIGFGHVYYGQKWRQVLVRSPFHPVKPVTGLRQVKYYSFKCSSGHQNVSRGTLDVWESPNRPGEEISRGPMSRISIIGQWYFF